MLVCSQDGRHFRGFINDRGYVDEVLARLKDQTTVGDSVVDLNGIDLEGGATPSMGSPSSVLLPMRDQWERRSTSRGRVSARFRLKTRSSSTASLHRY